MNFNQEPGDEVWLIFAPPECDHGTKMRLDCDDCEREFQQAEVA